MGAPNISNRVMSIEDRESFGDHCDQLGFAQVFTSVKGPEPMLAGSLGWEPEAGATIDVVSVSQIRPITPAGDWIEDAPSFASL